MQRHLPAAAHALLVLCVFGASVFPAAAQTTTRVEREIREQLRGERDLRRLEVTVAGSEATLTGELKTFRMVAKASLVCMMAGADFIKTSTGKEPVNATLPVSLVMVRMIREYYQTSGYAIGYKPAGGIGTAKDALGYLFLIKDELGRRWMEPDLLRFGASSLLGDIERQLEHATSGSYSAAYRLAMG